MKINKKLSIALMLVAMSASLFAKTKEAPSVSLRSYIPANSELTSSAKRVFKSRLDQIATFNNMGGKAGGRFIITGDVNILTKDVTPTAPPKVAMTIEFVSFIGDAITGKKFASVTTTAKAVGTNESKAFLSALKNLKARNPMFKEFTAEAKTKIIEFMEGECKAIILDAKSLTKQEKFDEALYALSTIPSETTCYPEVRKTAEDIFFAKQNAECAKNVADSKVYLANKEYVNARALLIGITKTAGTCADEAATLLTQIGDEEDKANLAKARSAWSSKNIEKTSRYLSEISASSKSAPEAIAIGKEVQAWVTEKDNREWSLKLKVQQDNVDLQKQSTDAMREVAVTRAKNPPKVEYNIIRGWWN